MYGVSDVIVNPSPAQPHAVSLRDHDRWFELFGNSRQASSGVKITHRSVIGYPPFWRGVNLLANGVAGLPLDVFRRDGEDRVVAGDHPAQKLIKRKASPILRSRKMIKTLMSHAILFGNGFAWVERDARLKPIGLWPLDPQNIIVRYMDDELWYSTRINGENVKFAGRNVLHITGLSHDGVCGYSALDIFADALGVGMAAQQFGGRFFSQGANMSGILMVPGSFTEEKIRNTMAAWQEMNEGLTRAHKVALMQDGVKWQPTSIDPDKGQFLETRNYEVRAVVASILGVPPHLLGDDSRTSHNSLEQENQSWLNHSLNPWLNEWEGELQSKLLSEREQEQGTHFIEFNREAAVQMLFTEKIEGLYRQVEMGSLTINEMRKKLNEPNIGPGGDKRFHPVNWAVIGEEQTETPAAPAVGSGSQPEPAASLRRLIAVNAADAVEVEKRRVVAAAKKEANFCGWLDGFYSTWCAKSVSGLDSPAARQVKATHAEDSKRQLLNVAGSSTPATLENNVIELVATWDQRAEQFAERLVEVA